MSSSKPRNTAGRSGRGARRGARRSGRAGSGRSRCQQNCRPRGQAFHVPFKASKKRHKNVFPVARTSEILCKPMTERNLWLQTGSSPVYLRFMHGVSAVYQWDEKLAFVVAADQWTEALSF